MDSGDRHPALVTCVEKTAGWSRAHKTCYRAARWWAATPFDRRVPMAVCTRHAGGHRVLCRLRTGDYGADRLIPDEP